MITESAKVFFPLSGLALAAAAVYAMLTGDRQSVGLFLGLFVAAALGGAVAGGFRDAAPAPAGAAAGDAEAPVARRDLAPTPRPAGGPWPLLVAIAVGLVAAGFAVGAAATVAGLIVAAVGLVGWVGLLTAERSGREINLLPLAIPVTALVFVGGLMFFMSRILLAVSAHASTAIAIAAATGVLAAAVLIASRPSLRPGAIGGVLAFAGALLVAGGLVAANAGTRHEEVPPKAAVGAAPDNPLSISAKNTKFDRTELVLAAGQRRYLRFDNRDGNVFHNVALYVDKDFTRALFNGEPVDGPRAVTYQIPPQPAGTYYFHCDFHPTMQGTVTVQP